jgi:hypothetical protein
MSEPALVTTVREATEPMVRITIGTLMTSPEQHRQMMASFEERGFGTGDCEFLVIDNSAGQTCDAYRGLNALLNAARGDIVVLCHQDVRLLGDGRAELVSRLAELERRAPDWAVAGNAGGLGPGRLALRISDPHGRDRCVGDLPARAQALDENLLIIRRSARLGFSRDLSGFHMYGADICLVADMLGWSAWVIDFHLEHLSGGRKDASFQSSEQAFRAKWSRAVRPRLLQTTCTLVSIAGDPVLQLFGRIGTGTLGRITRRLPSATGFGQGGRRP